jgi:phosphoribosylamine--glycine ligase
MDSKRFLFCSLDAALLADLAWQVHREGHEVRYYVAAESDREIGDGFVPKTDDWRGELDWADVVVFDDIWIGDAVGTGELAQDLRAQGHAVVGGTPATDRLEEDRGYAMEVLEANGIETIPHREFEDFQAGIDFVEANPAPYVIKPLGEVQNVKRLLYVGREHDGGDVVDVLRAYEKAWGHRMKGFQLQRKVEGVEVAVCGFFDGDVFVEPVNRNFEHNRPNPTRNQMSNSRTRTSVTSWGLSRRWVQSGNSSSSTISGTAKSGSTNSSDQQGPAPILSRACSKIWRRKGSSRIGRSSNRLLRAITR